MNRMKPAAPNVQSVCESGSAASGQDGSGQCPYLTRVTDTATVTVLIPGALPGRLDSLGTALSSWRRATPSPLLPAPRRDQPDPVIRRLDLGLYRLRQGAPRLR